MPASGKKIIDSKDMATLDKIKALAVICYGKALWTELIFLFKQVAVSFRRKMLQGSRAMEEGSDVLCRARQGGAQDRRV